MMNKDIVLEIKTLENDATYFGLIIKLSTIHEISKAKAWEIVEKRRKDWGLKPRYNTLMSYRMGERNFNLTGGQIQFEIPQLVFDSF